MSQHLETERNKKMQQVITALGDIETLPKLPLFTQVEKNTVLSLVSGLKDLRLGDEVPAFQPSSSGSINDYMGAGDTADVTTQDGFEYDFWIVCRGRVRLLCTVAGQAREISAEVIETGETFGADRLFCADLWRGNLWPYRAIAASPVQLACIPSHALKQALTRLPELQARLLATTQHRQQVIFFKTATQLRSLPSHQLQQWVTDLQIEQIPAGAVLAEVARDRPGRVWLRQGQVSDCRPAPEQLMQWPSIGDAWGYPEAVSPDWVAHSDLRVYRLPPERWDVLKTTMPALAAILEPADSGRAIAKGSAPATDQPLPKSAIVRVTPPNPLAQHPETLLTTAKSTEPDPLEFPKPTQRRRRQRSLWRRYPVVQQQSVADCGAACLAMVGKYWGNSLSLNWLRNLAGIGRSGTSLKGLALAAEGVGFLARPVRASLSRIESQHNPWIAHWQGDHYVVVYQIKPRRVVIADPAEGLRSLSREQFLSGWTGYALLLEPTERLQDREAQEKPAFGQNLLRLLVPHRSLVLQIVLASLLIQLFGLVTPLFTQVILDQVVVQKSLAMLHVFALGLLLFGVWQVAAIAIRQYLLDYFSNRIDLTLVSGFISHALRLPLKFFADRHVGDIVTRVQESQKIQVFLTRQVVIAWLDALMAVVYIGLMAYYNWHLTLLVLALIPPIVLLALGATPLLRAVSRRVFNAEAAENSMLVEMITGIATVKATAAEQEVRWRWENALTTMLNARFKGQALGNGLQTASSLINTLGSTALLWYGATLVIQGELSIGQFVAFNMLIGSVINPVLGVVDLWNEFQEVLVSVERMNDVFSATPEGSAGQLLKLPLIQGDLRFEDVTFRYGDDEERNTLQNITCEIRAGETIAIVGRSGSGKTTWVNLIQALYQPTRGRICIDGHDIRHVVPSSLRSQLGVVPQECFLFSGTILENITLYREEFSLEQAVTASKLAEAHTFIQSLPLGYNTKVGERGATLSGGQRQRIAIARALLGNPRILILDEATSSLDTESERRFQQNLMQISRDRTTLIIAHRLSTVRYADRILVLDQGILVEQGNHEELLNQKGLYCHLAQQQLEL